MDWAIAFPWAFYHACSAQAATALMSDLNFNVGDSPIGTAPRFILLATDWCAAMVRHREEVDRLTNDAMQRRNHGKPDPVEDFLFRYYRFSFAKLREWHPPFGIDLETTSAMPEWFQKAPYEETHGVLRASLSSLKAEQLHRLENILELLVATRDRQPNFGCHGLHEWAMVYRGTEIRHRESTPLRLPQEEIDFLVESRPIRCSHFDAFRFFHKDALPLNRLQPRADSRMVFEQAACIHANMDLYKWAGKSMPWIGSALWLETYRLAREVREIDMRASPYDLSGYGLAPIRVETSAGREEFEFHQKRLASKARILRQRLIDSLNNLPIATKRKAGETLAG